ncbi:elongation factor G [Novosphingobium album (ex Hu et al. 2023)]|uniref:Elongation factor G n=1 Tax=Novosphingobium album (ex Hu et al. 2023) TaxID=2930093 RepID=A0ABT0B7G5_9SPHN|nr:elongation factor G [Novosphingobium album (ex Hu et al. 2023)]MCJ2181017.1 elongation factor G [Novosphingobium album (ex Hu et al. 2023)]
MDTYVSGGHSGEFAHAARTVALVGPTGTGKTSLAEAILYASGAISRAGSVDAGSSVGDANAEARARGGSTEVNLSSFSWMNESYSLLDIPGSAGFVADGLAALQSADLALVVVDPIPERALLAEPLLRTLDILGIPHAIVVNRIETARAGSVHDLIRALQPLSREPLALRQIPIREGENVAGYVDLALERAYRYRSGSASQKIEIPSDVAVLERADRGTLLETLADFDDALLEILLMDEEPEPQVVLTDLAECTFHNKVVPIMLASALTGGGIRRLLKFLRHETPAPEAAAARLGTTNGIHIFKIAHRETVGRLAYARVYGEALHEGDELVTGGATVRCGALFTLQGEKVTKQASAAPGEVIAISKLDGACTGMLVARKGGASTDAPAPGYPARNASLAIEACDRKNDVKLSAALHKLCEEDPSLDWYQNEALHEMVLKCVNDDHLSVVLARLQRRYGITVDSRPAGISYKESIRKPASRRGRHKKQSGGHGQFGDVVLEIAPRPHGEGFHFAASITGGAVPKQWIPAVEMGVHDAMAAGPLGFPVVDVEVILTDGSYHSVDSSELAFRIAGRMAMSEALAAGTPYLLEPIVQIVVDTPPGTGSKAVAVLSSRRGQIAGLSPSPDWERWERVEGLLPEASLQGLDAELRSLSQGLAQFSARFDHLAELTGKQANEVVLARKVLATA